jgi:hypothetical protein
MSKPAGLAIVLFVSLTVSYAVRAQEEVGSASAEEGAPGGLESPDGLGVEGGEAAGEEVEVEETDEMDAESDEAMPSGTYTVRLRDLEDRINRLKEQIFRSKARLSLLAETVLDRKIAGAKASIAFRNEMGGNFRLVKATFLIDGGPIFNKADESGALADREVIKLFDGPVMPGDHTLSVVLHFRGHGYGIFSYLKGYAFTTRSSRTFTVQEGKAMQLDVVSYEKGGATTSLEDRPDVRYVMNVTDYEGGAAEDQADDELSGGAE